MTQGERRGREGEGESRVIVVWARGADDIYYAI
jgi:hypothetical protein